MPLPLRIRVAIITAVPVGAAAAAPPSHRKSGMKIDISGPGEVRWFWYEPTPEIDPPDRRRCAVCGEVASCGFGPPAAPVPLGRGVAARNGRRPRGIGQPVTRERPAGGCATFV